jgi:AraC-like DNA-binding protein
MQDITGEGQMTMYELFPGVVLLHNDFNMESCRSYFRSSADMLCMDYCHEGRIEWECGGHSCMFLEPSSMYLDTRSNHVRPYSFPLKRYRGLSVCILLEEASRSMPRLFPGFPVDLYALRNKYCLEGQPFVAGAPDIKGFAFADFYMAPKAAGCYYCKIKVLELLLLLNALELRREHTSHRYFPKHQVEKVKAIMAFITADLQQHHTLEELAAQFDMPLTNMKHIFKGVYGTSIYAYMRSCRIHSAAAQLTRTNDSIADIAARCGYDNASKFSAAFKSLMGCNPLVYRKSTV